MQNSGKRWFIAVMATLVHLCLGTVYAWSFFQKTVSETFGWSNSETADGTGYYYPFIDYGQDFERQNTAPASFFYTVEDFYPAIYLKEYVDRIFEAAGFTY